MPSHNVSATNGVWLFVPSVQLIHYNQEILDLTDFPTSNLRQLELRDLIIFRLNQHLVDSTAM